MAIVDACLAYGRHDTAETWPDRQSEVLQLELEDDGPMEHDGGRADGRMTGDLTEYIEREWLPRYSTFTLHAPHPRGVSRQCSPAPASSCAARWRRFPQRVSRGLNAGLVPLAPTAMSGKLIFVEGRSDRWYP